MIGMKILQSWTRYLRKGAENLTSLGPYRVKSQDPSCLRIQMYSVRREGIQYSQIKDTNSNIR